MFERGTEASDGLNTKTICKQSPCRNYQFGCERFRVTADSLHFKAGLSKIGRDVETENAMVWDGAWRGNWHLRLLDENFLHIPIVQSVG